MSHATEIRTQGIVQAGDARLFVTQIGTGSPLLWIHGGGPGGSAMGTFSANLPAFSGFRNLLVDLPGFGLSDRPDIQGSRLAYTAERVSNALTTLGVDCVSVVGISYGAGVALKLAAERPELVRRIVAVASGSAYPDGWTPTEPLRQIITYMSRSSPSRELMRRIFTAAAYDKTLVTEELLDERMTLARRNHPELPSAGGDSGLNADLPRVRVPVLALWGREDQFLGLDVALHVVRLIPDCELRVLPRCGHWLQADAPDRFNQIVLEFMEIEQ